MSRPRKHARRGRKAHKRAKGVLPLNQSRSQYATADYKTQVLAVSQETATKFLVAGCSSNSRIAGIAQYYQDYRVTKVKIKFMPNLNTFGAGTTTGYIPQMLTKQLDIQPPAAFTEAFLASMDPKTHELTQKDFTISFVPKVNMLASTTGATGQGVMIKRSPWLSTNANANTGGAWAADSTEHFGLLAWITNSAANASIGCGYQAEVFFEFRKPLAQVASTSYDKTGALVTPVHTEIHAL